jgi:hypothetical protein
MGPEMATAEASAIWTKKVDFQGPPLPVDRVMDKKGTLIVLISTAPAAPHTTFCCRESCKNLAVRTKVFTLITFK